MSPSLSISNVLGARQTKAKNDRWLLFRTHCFVLFYSECLGSKREIFILMRFVLRTNRYKPKTKNTTDQYKSNTELLQLYKVKGTV